MFLLRQRRQEKVQRQAEELRFVLDNQDAWIYVVDPHTHTLRYVNSKLQEKGSGLRSGTACYRNLQNREEPCDHCPLKNLENKENHACLLRNQRDRNTILLEATKIRWNGEDACLISGRRIPEE
jgi:putative two-component system response regulator